MNEKFLNCFIEFLEGYFDEEIANDERYKEQCRKCGDLARDGSKKEYEVAREKRDFLYRRLLCKKIFLLAKDFYQ